LPNGRLSEDVDLLALTRRKDLVEEVMRTLNVGVRRSHGVLTWNPSLVGIRDTQTAVATTQDGLSVRIQLLDSAGYPSWPYLRSDLEQRFSDAPAASLNVPTAAAFAAWKTSAWLDRHAARDLFDLHGLAMAGAISPEAGALFVRLGPFATLPPKWMFSCVEFTACVSRGSPPVTTTTATGSSRPVTAAT
jgi:predicted nucleotidyltransferase